MKLATSSMLLMFCLTVSCYSQSKFSITYNNGYESSPPTASPLHPSEVIEYDDAVKVFKYLKDDLGIEYRYSYGSCEDRAHALSMFLTKMNIGHRKIWNFEPSMITAFNKQQSLTAKDLTGINEKVLWSFHVAPIIFVRSNQKIDTLVIDPATSADLQKYRSWLTNQSVDSYYTFLDPQYLTFYTFNGLTYGCAQADSTYNVKIPPCFPRILTGDFRTYYGQDLNEKRVEEGLTVNETAMMLLTESKSSPADIQLSIKSMVSNIYTFTEILRTGVIPVQFQQCKGLLQKHISSFNERKNTWSAKLESTPTVKLQSSK